MVSRKILASGGMGIGIGIQNFDFLFFGHFRGTIMTLVTGRLSAALLVFISLFSNHVLVESFVSKPCVRNGLEREASFLNFDNKHRAPFAVSLPRVRSTSLNAVSPVVWSAIGHVLGGTTGVPVVAKGIKTWYKKVNLPPWTPPDRIFAPTWTLLYAAMGVAAGRIYQKVGGVTLPLILWACHYLLNLSWAPVFFGRKRLRLGLWMNLVLLTSLGYIIPLFCQIDALSAKLLLPYLAWLIFATALNWSVCSRNPTVDGYNNAKFEADLDQLQQQAAEYAGV